MKSKKEINAAVGWAANFNGRDRRFQWVGRDRSGVSRWEGERDALPWGANVLRTLGILFLLLGSGAFVIGRQPPVGFALAFVGAVLAGTAGWMYTLHGRLKHLGTADEVASAAGIDRDAIEQMASEQELKPRAMLNGEYLYDPQDLLPGSKLLRASQGPVEEALLRPAGSATVAQENLLRAAEEADEPAMSLVPPQTVDTEDTRLQQRT